MLPRQGMLLACVRCFSGFRRLGFGHGRAVWHPRPRPLARRFATLEPRAVPAVNGLGAEKEPSGPDEAATSTQVSRSYSHAEDQQILLRRKQGASWRDIAAELGRSVSAVTGRHRRLVTLYGYEGETKSHQFPRSIFTAEEDAYIIRRRAEAATFTTIASGLAASHSPLAVYRRWTQLVALGKAVGISLRGKRQKGMADGQYQYILALREKGFEWREIASHLQQRRVLVENMFYRKTLPRNTSNVVYQRWTDADIATLTRLREEDRKSWSEIATAMHRSYHSVMRKYHEVRPRGSGAVRRGHGYWTKAEDEKLLQLVKQHGTKWSSLGGLVGSRTADAIKARYIYIHPKS